MTPQPLPGQSSDLVPAQDGFELSVQINVERDQHGYQVRCHGADGTATMGGATLSEALDELAYWARRQAAWNRSEGR